jgi:hypothetical protein
VYLRREFCWHIANVANIDVELKLLMCRPREAMSNLGDPVQLAQHLRPAFPTRLSYLCSMKLSCRTLNLKPSEATCATHDWLSDHNPRTRLSCHGRSCRDATRYGSHLCRARLSMQSVQKEPTALHSGVPAHQRPLIPSN